jgi:osomolarity two-component system sensor histidine kinase NIK1
MLGDREKCIQAQMDEYLSKPLKQNHLIQTILKCATLGGALLEKGRDVRSSPKDEAPKTANAATPNGTPATPATPVTPATPTTAVATAPPSSGASTLARPPIEPRAFTTTGPISHGSLESPGLVTADSDDPLARVS